MSFWRSDTGRGAARSGRQRVFRRVVFFVLIALGATGLMQAQMQAGGGTVVTAHVTGEIDSGTVAYVDRVLDLAEKERARAVVVEIDTPGGRLDAALALKNALLQSGVRTVAFVNREAFSAGALIAMATERIYMPPGAELGAATPVNAGTGETASEKVVSAVRTTFRSVAEARGLDPLIAEAMVDPDVEVQGLVERGKLLTLTTSQAVDKGYAVQAGTLREVLEKEGLGAAASVDVTSSLAEALVRIITNPIVSAILIAVGFLGLLIEALTPGFGVPGILGVLGIGLFFWGHYLARLAGYEGVALVVLGVALLTAEVFLIPGFGVAGLLGIVAFVAGIFLTLVGDAPTSLEYTRALLVITSSVVLVVIGGYLAVRFLPRRRMGGLVLQARLERTGSTEEEWRLKEMIEQGWDMPPLAGMQGTAVTALRPGGTVEIQGRRIDVTSVGGFVEEGTVVEVVDDDGYRRTVRPSRTDGQAR